MEYKHMQTFTEYLTEDAVKEVVGILNIGLRTKLKGKWAISRNSYGVAMIDSDKGTVEQAKAAIDAINGTNGKWKASAAGGDVTMFRGASVLVVDTGSVIKVMVM
jgi:hypothetical protein